MNWSKNLWQEWWPISHFINAWLQEDFIPEYLIDSNWNICITYQLWKSFWISSPSSKVDWIDLNEKCKSLISKWYQFIWETDKNWNIPNYLKDFLESWNIKEIKTLWSSWITLFFWKTTSFKKTDSISKTIMNLIN